MSPRAAKRRSGKAAASRSDQARAGLGGRAGAVRAGAGAVRCAIYTRKSSEEGLEQDFNSLHAQREACEAYVASQRHEGWTVLPEVYDDGGFSGGSLERPALRGLLAAIDAGGVDVVVVYKVDRLTRSLADFAKIVEVLKLVVADRQETHRDRGLIGRLAQGYLWFEELRTGAVSSLAEIAEREGIEVPMVRRACDLAFLSTDMIEAILAGEQPIELNSEAFKVAYPLPIGWEEQRRVLGFA